VSAHQSGAALLEALESGEVRAATPTGSDEGAAGWAIHSWVKLAILDLFRGSPITATSKSCPSGASTTTLTCASCPADPPCAGART
jgi:hypothetical protein